MLPKRSTRSHADGHLTATVSQVSEGGPYSIDFNPPKPIGFDTTFASMEAAQREADLRVAQRGHTCDATCSDWRESH